MDISDIIRAIMSKRRTRVWEREITTIKEFVEKCSVAEFEKIKNKIDNEYRTH